MCSIMNIHNDIPFHTEKYDICNTDFSDYIAVVSKSPNTINYIESYAQRNFIEKMPTTYKLIIQHLCTISSISQNKTETWASIFMQSLNGSN